MTYRDELHGLAQQSEDDVVGVFDQFTAGEITRDVAIALIAAIIARANARAVTLADLSLAATLMVTTGAPVAAAGVLPDPTDQTRLAKAATTLLDVVDVTPARVARLGRVEPLNAAGKAFSEAIEKQPIVTGWKRGVSGSGCQLCTWWSRGGQVWPDSHIMPRHKGCTCTQIPVTTN